MPGDRAAHLVSAAELRDTPPARLVLLDVRTAGERANYQREHLPGARFADVDADLSGTPTADSGARPLPDTDHLTESLRRWGIHPDSTVVVYDDARSVAAARAWWVLRWAGLTDVRILDGGLRAWHRTAGTFRTAGTPGGSNTLGEPGTAVARPGALPVIETSGVAALPGRGTLFDARPLAHFHGAGEYPGHIPGAISAPVFDDFDGDGLLLDEATLRARYHRLGVDAGTPAASYCGSAMAAALQVFVLATLGIEVALYPGSLSQWVADPARPLTTEPSVALTNS
ncbi:rhodanese-like domain-containing protein [Nocardia sp. NPDC050378]|uniref:sulfurtransferase n=1 Tax=Nocardia sp. NPDC050378 TaxID=3155400 RepID=UPI0033CCE32A